MGLFFEIHPVLTAVQGGPTARSAVRVLKKILIGIGVLIVLALIAGFFMPEEWKVEETIMIDAPPESIHAWVGNLRRWPQWTPWNEEMDPTVEYSYEGPEEGAGQISKWNGKKAGEGELTVTKSSPKTGLFYDLWFADTDAVSKGSIMYEHVPDQKGTKVTWSNLGALGRNPLLRLFGPVIEGAVSDDFSKGLAKLKVQVESSPPPAKTATTATSTAAEEQ